MIRSTYKRIVKLAHTKYAVWALAAVSFAESSFFPIPPDTMLIPMVLTYRQRAWYFATICTVASVCGGLVGYALGAWLYDTLGHYLIDAYGMADQMEKFRAMYQHYGAAIILLKGLTPIPYKLVTIASGVAGYPLPLFILFSAITRGARFFLVAGLLRQYGEPVREIMEKHLELFALAFLGVIVAGFLAFKFLF